MKKYRNVKTGVTVQIEGEAKGDWVLVSDTPSSVPEKKPVKRSPKKK